MPFDTVYVPSARVTLVCVQFGAVSLVPHNNTDDAVNVAPVAAASLVNRSRVCVAPKAPDDVSAVAVGGGITVGV